MTPDEIGDINTSEQSADFATKERPTIADKVMFWEEQDRINRELIPRVIKQHDLFASHLENHESAALHLAEMEARWLEKSRRQDAELRAIIKATQSEVDSKLVEIQTRADNAIRSSKHQSLIVSASGIAIAIIALILAAVL